MIDAHNAKHKAGKVSFTLGLNEFSTLTTAEINARNGFKDSKRCPMKIILFSILIRNLFLTGDILIFSQ
jgi:hypothetical protein